MGLLGNIVHSLSAPLIIAGDLNSEPGSTTITFLVDSLLTRSCKAGCDLTFPWDKPTRKIDYIMYHPVTKFQVIKGNSIHHVDASDHLPVIEVLDIR
jgi:endonuclease/exonuclease/phosphatase family metal-dependent hydrolase